jgi:hypothetical protein
MRRPQPLDRGHGAIEIAAAINEHDVGLRTGPGRSLVAERHPDRR